MKTSLMTAIAGACGGAILGAALVFVAAATGHFPGAAGGRQIHDYLMANSQILADMSNRLQNLQQAEADKASAAAIKQLGLKPFFDSKVAFVTGPADAKKSVVEFYDYDCPYCRASLPAVEQFYQAHKNDTRFSFIEFPLPTLHGPNATLAARLSLAARKQPDKFLALHFALMGQQNAANEQNVYEAAEKAGLDMDKLKADMADPEIDKTIAASHELALKAGIDGTPTFIVNGVVRPGAVDEPTLASYANS